MLRATARGRWTVLLGWVALTLAVLPAAARAMQAPELYIRAGPHATWTPLNGARLTSIAMELGVKLQQTDAEYNRQYFVVTFTQVPDGSVDQRNWDGARCQAAADPAGSISSLGAIDYQGNGTYSVQVAAYTDAQGSAPACSGGPASTGSFTVSATPTLNLVGAPLFVHSSRSHRNHGFRVNGSLGTTELETTCGTDATRRPDGSIASSHLLRESEPGNGNLSLTSASYSELDFDRPGLWTCVARARGGYLIRHGTAAATPWTAPITTLMREPFALTYLPKALFGLAWTDRTAPSYAIAGRALDPFAAGGRLTLTFRPTPRCQVRHRPIAVRGKVGRGGNFSLRFRLPFPRWVGELPHVHLTAPQRWTATLSFGGTRLILPGSFSIELVVDDIDGHAYFPVYQGVGC